MIKKLRKYLQTILDVPVLFERPPDAECGQRMVILQRTGESIRNRVTTYTVAARSYGPTMLDASELNDTLELAVLIFGEDEETDATTRIETSYNNTDPAQKEYRFQTVFQMTFVNRSNNGQ